MGYARILVSAELLREALHLPRDTNILFAKMEAGFNVELTVSHPDLVGGPSPGELPPMATPTFRKQEPIVFEGWNQR